ncbi:MAG TPA: hypothetical protein PK950_01580 [Candidatus Paceibacterota bacterium]|nr:hypothetical protein [Candidatus Paceibacterota bacterium]
MVTMPKVIISYSGFLDEVYTNYFTSDSFKESIYYTQHKTAKVLSSEEVKEKHKLFVEEWKKYEEKIFISMYEASGLSLKRNTIDVYLIRVAARTFANPIIISASISTMDFVSLLIHEIIHRLINEGLGSNKKKLLDISKKLYPGETESTIIHITLYAIQFSVLETFPDAADRMALEKTNAERFKNTDYSRAIEIVEKEGYSELLKKLKEEMVK